jgi:hypothetical protein
MKVNNNEMPHICVGTRHGETHQKLLNNTRLGERMRKSNSGG